MRVLFLSFIFLLLSFAAIAQRYVPATQIPVAIYPAASYFTQADSFNFGKLTIRLANIKAREHQTVAFWCRASIAVMHKTDTIFSRYFADVDAVGGCSGVYMEPVIRGGYVFVSKFGDYNGRTIVIDSTGNTLDMHGGITYYNPLIDWIVAEHNSDIGGLSVYNTKTEKLVFDSEEPQINGDTCFTCGRYLTDVRYDERYLYVVYMNDEENFGNQTGMLRAFRFEHDTQQVTLAAVPAEYIDALPKLEAINDPTDQLPANYCNCGAPIIKR